MHVVFSAKDTDTTGRIYEEEISQIPRTFGLRQGTRAAPSPVGEGAGWGFRLRRSLSMFFQLIGAGKHQHTGRVAPEHSSTTHKRKRERNLSTCVKIHAETARPRPNHDFTRVLAPEDICKITREYLFRVEIKLKDQRTHPK